MAISNKLQLASCFNFFTIESGILKYMAKLKQTLCKPFTNNLQWHHFMHELNKRDSEPYM